MNIQSPNALASKPQLNYSFEAAYGSSDDTKEEALEVSLSKSIHKIKDDEIESLLDEIEYEYEVTVDRDDDLIAFGVNDEAIEEQEIIIDDILDEIEKQEDDKNNENEKEKEQLWEYSQLVKDVIDGNNNSLNAFKLRLHKQRTFGNFLKMEQIIAQYSLLVQNNNEINKAENEDIFIHDTNFFFCPSKMDYLLHGFIRNIMRETIAQRINEENNNNDNWYTLCHMVPHAVITLVHLYYLCANNQYHDILMKQHGINWTEHRVIVQHQSCDLWRWNLSTKAWIRSNGDACAQCSLLYDDIKGFTRFVHFDHGKKEMRCLQIIEANEKIHAENITHNDEKEESVFEFGGFDFMNLSNNNNNNNELNYGEIQRFKLLINGANHRYYCKQFVKCYNNIVQSEIKNEIKMLKKIELFQVNSDDTKEAQQVPDLAHLNEYVLGLQSRDDIDKHIKYARLIRRLLSNECSPPIQEIIDCGIIQRLIYLMRNSSSYIVKFECAWSLTNIASGNREHTLTLIRFNAIAALLNVFRAKESIVEIKEQCLWALGNIAGDSVACRNEVLNGDILKYLVPLIRPYRMLMFRVSCNNEDNDAIMDDNNKMSVNLCQRQRTFMRNLVWTLSNLNRNKPLPASHHIILSLHAINIILKDALCVADCEVMQDCCWTLSYLSDYNFNEDEAGGIQLDLASILLDSGIIDILIALLKQNSATDSIKHPALRTIGNIATGNDYLTNKLLNKIGILEAITHLLKNTSMSAIKRETLWLISNITAGDTQQIELVLQHSDLLVCILNILNNEDEESSVKREAIWALSNATSGGSDDQIRFICNNNGIQSLASYLNECVEKEYFGRVLIVCCEGLENILHVGARDALFANNPNINPMQAVFGRNTQNLYANTLQATGALNDFDRLLNNQKCATQTKERIVNILDAYFPFRDQAI